MEEFFGVVLSEDAESHFSPSCCSSTINSVKQVENGEFLLSFDAAPSFLAVLKLLARTLPFLDWNVELLEMCLWSTYGEELL